MCLNDRIHWFANMIKLLLFPCFQFWKLVMVYHLWAVVTSPEVTACCLKT
jgi:hypothetical protein